MKTGHGVYDWTDIDPDTLEKQRDEELLQLLDVYENLDRIAPEEWYNTTTKWQISIKISQCSHRIKYIYNYNLYGRVAIIRRIDTLDDAR